MSKGYMWCIWVLTLKVKIILHDIFLRLLNCKVLFKIS
jgi:hypothetical protein